MPASLDKQLCTSSSLNIKMALYLANASRNVGYLSRFAMNRVLKVVEFKQLHSKLLL